MPLPPKGHLETFVPDNGRIGSLVSLSLTVPGLHSPKATTVTNFIQTFHPNLSAGITGMCPPKPALITFLLI